MSPIIEFKNLTHRFANGTQALDGVDLRIESGSFVVFAGQNGSGKTTLLKHLNGLLLPTRGTVAIDGKPVQDHIRFARRFVGMVFQDPEAQIVAETVAEDVAFGPQNLGLAPNAVEEKVEAVLKAVGLTDAAFKRVFELSGGEKRRLAIAGVLAMGPRVVVFDEPFASLDYPGVKQAVDVMSQLHGSGHTVLAATHWLEMIVDLADRLIVMHAGKIVRDGMPVDVLPDVEAFGVRMPAVAPPGLGVAS